MLKKTLFLLVALAISASHVGFTSMRILGAETHSIGDIVGYTLYTDIVTYINDFPIRTYNIENRTAVCVEDLAHYGFDVEWNQGERTLTLTRAWNKEVVGDKTFVPEKIDKKKTGDKNLPVSATDIKCVVKIGNTPSIRLVDGYDSLVMPQPKTFNINGKTLIYVDELLRYTSSYKYNDIDRTLRLVLVDYWVGSCVPILGRYSLTFAQGIPDASDDEPLGFSYTFKSLETDHSDSGGTYRNFERAGFAGDYWIPTNFTMTSYGFTFGQIEIDSIKKHAPNSDFVEFINSAMFRYTYKGEDSGNGRFDCAYSDFSEEGKARVNKIIQVYVNGTKIKGTLHEFSVDDGKVAAYVFMFDKYMNAEAVETVKIVIGTKYHNTDYSWDSE